MIPEHGCSNLVEHCSHGHHMNDIIYKFINLVKTSFLMVLVVKCEKLNHIDLLFGCDIGK